MIRSTISTFKIFEISKETAMSLVTIATFRDSTGIPRAWGIAADKEN
jgi:hypothetical protein